MHSQIFYNAIHHTESISQSQLQVSHKNVHHIRIFYQHLIVQQTIQTSESE